MRAQYPHQIGAILRNGNKKEHRDSTNNYFLSVKMANYSTKKFIAPNPVFRRYFPISLVSLHTIYDK